MQSLGGEGLGSQPTGHAKFCEVSRFSRPLDLSDDFSILRHIHLHRDSFWGAFQDMNTRYLQDSKEN